MSDKSPHGSLSRLLTRQPWNVETWINWPQVQTYLPARPAWPESWCLHLCSIPRRRPREQETHETKVSSEVTTASDTRGKYVGPLKQSPFTWEVLYFRPGRTKRRATHSLIYLLASWAEVSYPTWGTFLFRSAQFPWERLAHHSCLFPQVTVPSPGGRSYAPDCYSHYIRFILYFVHFGIFSSPLVLKRRKIWNLKVQVFFF